MLDGVASSLYVIMQYYQAVRIRKKIFNSSYESNHTDI